ncbi:MAG: hypothetical protein AMK70_00195 [Nitrospira bacterium SG8_35_1]|nr:MAG: hypothetical protein AMK70_00195 [Nitrospira bacterium SG8_35_1]
MENIPWEIPLKMIKIALQLFRVSGRTSIFPEKHLQTPGSRDLFACQPAIHYYLCSWPAAYYY